MKLCPCQSGLDYQDCCQPIHQQPDLAITPEALMRSRFSAHVLKLVDYVVDTYHPTCHAAQQREEIAQSVNLPWCKLEVFESSVSAAANEGYVEFEAAYLEDGALHFMRERSRFLREEDNRWYYVDGQFDPSKQRASQKVQRNDACPCLSGKKFKKCCG